MKLALLLLLLPVSTTLAAPPLTPETLGSTAWRANNTNDIAVDFAGRVIVNHGGGVDVRSLDGTRRTIFEARLAGPRTRMTTTPDGRVVAIAKGGVLRRFDHEGRELGSIALEHGGGDIALSDDGTRVAALDGATVRVVSTKDGKTQVNLVGGEDDRFDQVAFAPDGKSIAAVSRRNGVRVWSLPSGEPIVRTSPYPKGGVTGDLAFGADGTLAVRGWSDLVVWPAGSTKARIARPGNGLYGLAACGADKFLALSNTLGLVLINSRSGAVEPLVPNWKPSSSKVANFAASTDCTRAALALGDGSVRLIDVPSRRILAEPSGHLDEVLALPVLPRVFWMQLGVRNDAAAAKAEAAGMKVVMDRCPKIEYGRLSSEISWMGVNSRTLSSKRAPMPVKGLQRLSLERQSFGGASTEAADRAAREK